MKAENGLRQLVDEMRLEAECGRRLLAYLALLRKWNARVNLTASVEWPAVGPLFEEALWAARFYASGAARQLDIGSGAGFPALPLAVLRPDIQFELVESRSRRAVFLEVAARELGLTRVRIVERRLAEYLSEPLARGWDVISWKALKIAGKDVSDLLGRAPGASFWLFHGSDLPVEDPGAWSGQTRLQRRAEFPGRPGWFLSVFHVKRQ